VATEYSKRFGPAVEFNRRIVTLNGRAEFDQIVGGYRTWRAQFLDENQRLRPCYAPRPFETAIPVPRGPNELW